MPRKIGAHVSAAGGVHKAVERAAAIGANCVQVFSGSPRGWKRADLGGVDAAKVAAAQKQHGIGKTFSPINLWDVTIKAGKTAELNIPKTHNVMLLVRRGEVRVNDGDQSAQAKQLITFAKESGAKESGENGMDTVRLTAGEAGSEILLMSGEPLNEPIAYRGPFVMNTDAEIREAMLEFGRGDFGKLSPVS